MATDEFTELEDAITDLDFLNSRPTLEPRQTLTNETVLNEPPTNTNEKILRPIKELNFKFILNAAAILQIRTIVSIRSLIFHNFVRFGVVNILVRSSTNVVFRVSFCVHSSYFIEILWNDYFRV